MGQVILYVAASLDGMIADEQGGLDWLHRFEGGEEDYGYAKFYTHVGTVIMGGNTYRQVLGFEQWPYEGVACYVVTSKEPDELPPGVRAFAGDVEGLVARIREVSDKDIWLVGGADLVSQFVNRHLIDEYIVSIIPVLLGQGVPLFQNVRTTNWLELVGSQAYPNGIVQVHYRVVPEEEAGGRN